MVDAMTITYKEYLVAKEEHPNLIALDLAQHEGRDEGRGSPRDDEPVVAVVVTVEGILGNHDSSHIDYQILADVRNIRTSLPQVWVLKPTDEEIRHVNIWRATDESHAPCEILAGRMLPSFCWAGFGSGWANARDDGRVLGSFVEYVKQFLSIENHGSSAR